MWGKQTVLKDTNYSYNFGKRCILIRKSSLGWHLKCDELEVSSFENLQPTDKVFNISEFNTYSADDHTGIIVTPTTPDKPIVIRPEKEFTLQANSKVTLTVLIPLWIRLYHKTISKENLMCETASEPLSKTWLGEPSNGQIAFAIRVHPFTKTPYAYNYAKCRITILNSSSHKLNFQRFLLDSDHLSIYSTNDNEMYTSDVQVKFKGESTVSDVVYSKQVPKGVENALKISEARNPEKKDAITRSFFFIKSFTQF